MTNANKGKPLTRKEIWQFLKCFKLLSYDFASVNSTDQAHILNLICISKASNIAASPLEIWNSLIVLCTIYNRNGGSIDLNSLKGLDEYKYFDPAIMLNANLSLQKLTDDGNLIFKPIHNTVKDFHIDRTELREKIFYSTMNNQLTFVTGAPGAGKSALVKELLGVEYRDSLPFIFKADQFNKSSLSQVFSDIGITHNLTELLGTITLVNDKIIIIDSAEKLLEGDPDSAFKQLLEFIKEHEDLRVLITSRAYAVNIIVQKYDINELNLIEVPLLSDFELQSVGNSFSQIGELLDNKEIKEILRSPKYLEFALKAIDKSEFQSHGVSLADFKDKLWFHIIENGNVVRNGIARKRDKTFRHIAVGRALNMGLFFEPDDAIVEYDAVDALLNDDVISKNGIKYEFSPSHDILEDWALVRYIALVNSSLDENETLFEKLGNQPALRRAFRLWIEEQIIKSIDTVLELVKTTLENNSVERYWCDEILTAIFRSKECKAFFGGFKNQLLENKAHFLNRCILVCRTSCKEYIYNDDYAKDVLLPIGSVWEEVLGFIAENYKDLLWIRNTIFDFLMDWECKYIFVHDKCCGQEIFWASYVTMAFIKEIEDGEEFWFDSYENNKKECLIYTIFNFSPYDENKEIENFLERILKWKRKESSWKFNGFYEKASIIALGGVRNERLIQKFPDLIIDLANKIWKNSKEKEVKKESVLGFSFPERREKEDSWGVKDQRFDFFPSGAYKTFVYAMLRKHPLKGVAFVVDFTNYMVESYVQSDYGREDNISKVKIDLNSGEWVEEYSNDLLWMAYRGTVVSHYLLESILAGFEKYMLELAQSGESSEAGFQLIVHYCLKKSNSVVLTSILVSIFTAYPNIYGKEILPLLQCREFYELDLHRAVCEGSALAPYDEKIPYAQKERYESNRLSHRRKYQRGLRDFIFQYQFMVAALNKEIFEILDHFYENCEDDIIWEKAVFEMDSRKYKTSRVEGRNDVIQLEVEYSDKILTSVTEIIEERKYEDASASYANTLREVANADSNAVITHDRWTEIYLHYAGNEEESLLFDLPVSLAVIGLRDFLTEMSEQQKEWCLNVIFNTLVEVTKRKLNYGNLDMPVYNISEEQLTIESIHLLFANLEDSDQLDDLKVTIGYLLIGHLSDNEQKEIGFYIRNVFFKHNPDFAVKIWSFLISFSRFYNANGTRIHYRNEEARSAYNDKRHEFIIENILDEGLENGEANFEHYNAHFLALALLMVKSEVENERQRNFILKFTDALLNDYKLRPSYSDYSNSGNNRKLDTSTGIRINFALNEILLYSEADFASKLLNVLIGPYLDKDFKVDSSNKDMHKFSDEVLSTLITRFDDIVVARNKKDIEKYGANFWMLWKELFNKLKPFNKNYFAKSLLLDSDWNIKSDSWPGFLNEKKFYEEVLLHYGAANFSSVLIVFSTFGERLFLPEKLPLLIRFLNENAENRRHLISQSSKLLIKKLFSNHIGSIKNSQILVSDFVCLLNMMVDLGIPEAYLIRECVIIYKRK